MNDKESALRYHAEPIPGKIGIVSTKPCESARDLALAYSPGVAAPCLEIAKDQEQVYNYTSKGNLVAVITNGTAVLGLGDIGPHASKPVMEGKGVLFKSFAHVDVFDLELDCKSKDEFINTVKALAPTFGGINLEDIKAPECFDIEEELIELLDIPVFHDDQHGTAIIASAALLNALELTNRKIDDVSLVVSGAGAAAIATAKLLVRLGLPKGNITLCDSQGVVHMGRSSSLNKYKMEFVKETENRNLADALKGADIFFGLSKKDVLTPEMLNSMANDPIVFAMANPDPEIDYQLAVSTRDDVIMATGRSDWPNQVNNVLGFPYIFRGALDVRARKINEEMKLAAVRALARLAKEPVPESVKRAYGNTLFSFGKEYLIPKPFDPRVLYYVAPAVAEAAMKSGVARKQINIEDYTLELKGKQHQGRVMLRGFYDLASKSLKKKIVFAEGEKKKVIQAAEMACREGIAEPILIGNRENIEAISDSHDIDCSLFAIFDPETDSKRDLLLSKLPAAYKDESKVDNTTFASLMLVSGKADGLIAGVGKSYPDVVRPIFQIVGVDEKVTTAASLYLLSIDDRLFFIADAGINTEMNSDKLASIAIMSAEFARSMDIVPRVAMLSYSDFGSVNNSETQRVREATIKAREIMPDLMIDGEMQADTAVDKLILELGYPDSKLKKPANILIFPDMQSANISYKLLQRLGGARVVGPVILGVKQPAYALQKHASVDEIFNMITVAVARASIQSDSA